MDISIGVTAHLKFTCSYL